MDLLKKFLGFSIGPIVGALISFITIPITTYFVTPQEYGKAGMFALYQSLVVTFLYLGLDQSYTREYHEADDRTNLLKNSILLPLLLSFIILLIIVFNSKLSSKLLFDSPKYSDAAILFGITLVFLVIERFILLSIRMEEKAIEYSTVNIFLKLMVLIFTIIILGVLQQRNFLAIIYSNVIGQLFVDTYLFIRYREYLDFRNYYFDKEQLITLLKFGTPIILSASINSLLSSFDRIALKIWGTYYDIGIFTAALKISATLTILQTCFTTFWTPVAYRWYSEEKDIEYYKFISDVVLLFMSILFCIILIFKGLIIIFLSSKYEDAKFIFGLLCLYPIMYTLSETTTLGIVFSRKSYFNIFVSVISFVVNVVVNIVFTPRFGVVGAATATAISYIVFFICRSLFSKHLWKGFSLKIHMIVMLLLFFAALINTQNEGFILIINLVALCTVIVIQIPNLKSILRNYKIIRSKNKY